MMNAIRKHFYLFLITLCTPCFSPNLSAYIQEPDTILAYQYFQYAQQWNDSSQFDSASIYFDKAGKEFQILAEAHQDSFLWVRTLKMYNEVGRAFVLNSEFDRAIPYFNELIPLCKRTLGEGHLVISDLYNNLGIAYFRKGQYQLALDYFKQVLEIRKANLGELNTLVAMSYNNIGAFYNTQANYKQALTYFQKALAIQIKLGKNEDKITGSIYSSIGLALDNNTEYKKAVFSYEKGLNILKKALGVHSLAVADLEFKLGYLYQDIGEFSKAFSMLNNSLTNRINLLNPNHLDIAASYGSLGVYYYRSGQYGQALDYYFKALHIFQKVVGKEHNFTASYYINIGKVYQSQGDFDQALSYFQQALKIHLNQLGATHPKVAESYFSLGTVYQLQQQHESALSFHEKALHIRLNKLGSKHLDVAASYDQLGIIYKELFQPSQALIYHRKALKIRQDLFERNHPTIIQSFLNLGNAYKVSGNFEKAYDYYQNALNQLPAEQAYHPTKSQIYNEIADLYQRQDQSDRSLAFFEEAISASYYVPDFHQELHREDPIIPNKYVLLTSLLGKGNLLEQKKSAPHCLLQADSTYQYAIQLISLIRNQYKQMGSKLSLQEKVQPIYEGGIRTAISLFQQTQDTLHAIRAFQIAEKSKAHLLSQSIQETRARNYVHLPDSVQQLEESLRLSLTFYEKELFETRQSGQDSSKVSTYEKKIFQLQHTYDSLLQVLEANYPQYYQLKYQQATPSPQEIQRSLPPNTTLIEYFTGDHNLYTFLVRPDTFMIFPIPTVASEINAQVEQIRMGIYGAYIGNPKDFEALRVNYLHVAHQLHQALIAPISAELTSRLIIIPDGMLGYLPFEALLTQASSPATRNPDLSFLLKSHSISYAFSSSLLLEQQRLPSTRPTQSLLAIAPQFPFRYDKKGDTELYRREYLGPLPYNKDEVVEIQEIWGGEAWYDERASRSEFLKHANNYRILHLSSHGKTNDEDPRYSFIAFTEPRDSLILKQDTIPGLTGLFVADLYNLQLNADMVVLSACETGVGKLYRGEGIASLARGFTYAGARSLVTTLWSVNDRASANFMKRFYIYLKEGHPKDVAIQKAKLDGISIGENPFFWAGYVALGDMSPLSLPEKKSPWIFVAGLLILLSIFGFWRRNRSRRMV